MTLQELTGLAEGERFYEAVAGQLWLEHKRILKRINSRPPQMRIKLAKKEIAALRQRVEGEGIGTSRPNRPILVAPEMFDSMSVRNTVPRRSKNAHHRDSLDDSLERGVRRW